MVNDFSKSWPFLLSFPFSQVSSFIETSASCRIMEGYNMWLVEIRIDRWIIFQSIFLCYLYSTIIFILVSPFQIAIFIPTLLGKCMRRIRWWKIARFSGSSIVSTAGWSKNRVVRGSGSFVRWKKIKGTASCLFLLFSTFIETFLEKYVSNNAMENYTIREKVHRHANDLLKHSFYISTFLFLPDLDFILYPFLSPQFSIFLPTFKSKCTSYKFTRANNIRKKVHG